MSICRHILPAALPSALAVTLTVALAVAPITGCAAPTGGERHVYFATPSYACSAAPDLGCGLALQPVLARIDALDGVASSYVSWDGLTVRIDVLPGANVDDVAKAAGALLEGPARRIPAREAAAVQAWFGTECCLDLSLHEAGVLASDLAGEMAAAAELDAEQRLTVEGLLREALERAFREAHAAGGGVDRLWERLPAAREAFEAGLAHLPPERRSRIAAFLDEQLGAP